MADFRYDICVVGGCGHVGLPLAITFADRGLKVSVYDIDERAVATVRSGRMPFLETAPSRSSAQVIGRTLEVVDRPGVRRPSRGTWSS